MWKKFCQNPLVKFLASLKLAVIVIVSFTGLMIWGTLTESRFGAEYAKNLVYFSPLFIGVQIFLFLNILFAALVRLPWKKRLSGFYVIHLGLLLVLSGAAMTALWGIDGNLELSPGQANAKVLIQEPQLYVTLRDKNNLVKARYQKNLPREVQTTQGPDSPFLSLKDYDLYLERYLPYALSRQLWEDKPRSQPSTRALWLELKNDSIQQSLQLANFEPGQEKQKLGPLNLQFLSSINSKCFAKGISNSKIEYLFQYRDQCIPIEQINAEGLKLQGFQFKLEKEKSKPVISLHAGSKVKYFVPTLSPFPINKHLKPDRYSGMNLLKLAQWREDPQVIFFKDQRFGAGKKNDWKFSELKGHTTYPLPWMQLNMTLTRQIDNKVPKTQWTYQAPRGEKSKRQRAAKIKLVPKNPRETSIEFWIDDRNSKLVSRGSQGQGKLEVWLGPKAHSLPFGVELANFKMETNPGTKEAASYESFVKVEGEAKPAHIYMNHPLKKAGFTLYQSSYFSIGEEKYGSILSVNRDPGRWVKYLGSLLLVLGSVAHFSLRAYEGKKKNPLSRKEKGVVTENRILVYDPI